MIQEVHIHTIRHPWHKALFDKAFGQADLDLCIRNMHAKGFVLRSIQCHPMGLFRCKLVCVLLFEKEEE